MVGSRSGLRGLREAAAGRSGCPGAAGDPLAGLVRGDGEALADERRDAGGDAVPMAPLVREWRMDLRVLGRSQR